jgi:beta-phosphoglucomutase-like phosphatase (HAD superfamily)
MTYKAAVFDLDGTLINSLSDLTDSGNEVLEKYPWLLLSLSCSFKKSDNFKCLQLQ